MLLQPEKSDFILAMINEVEEINPEVIGHLWKRAKSKISTKINIGRSRLFYPFGISSEIYSQM